MSIDQKENIPNTIKGSAALNYESGNLVGMMIYTIGHSTHELDLFLTLLKNHNITAIADVRSQPYSNRLAHFNRDVLTSVLKTKGIQYIFLGAELGARRDEIECYVNGQALYERVAQLPRFREGIERLVKGAATHVIALMCAEKDPLDCHRTVLVCRHLRAHGLRIRHILGDGTIEEHDQTEKRLQRMMEIEPNLFEPEVTERDLIERAYEARGKQIAYRAGQEGSPE